MATATIIDSPSCRPCQGLGSPQAHRWTGLADPGNPTPERCPAAHRPDCAWVIRAGGVGTLET